MSDSSNSDDSPAVPGFVKSDDADQNYEVINEDTPSTVSNETDGRDVEMVDLDEADPSWKPYFRYDAAYSDQYDAIESLLNVLGDNGYYGFEGACGTGKTLASVTAGIHAIRDNDDLDDSYCAVDETFPDYWRLFAVTPLKQQLLQFVDEMRGINRSLPASVDKVPTVTMRSRGDMMAYSQADVDLPDTQSFNDTANELREMTRDLIRFDSDIPLDWPAEMSPSPFSHFNYDWDSATTEAEEHRESHRYNPERAEAVTRILSNLETMGGSPVSKLTVDGTTAPYPSRIPATQVVADVGHHEFGPAQLPEELQGNFDPFYAGAFAGYDGLPFSFDDATNHVFNRDDLFDIAVSNGICPHEAMVMLAGRAEVILGNYYHIFDPQTRLLTDNKLDLLDEHTIVTVDEAHQVESRVRDILSESASAYTLSRAENDIDIIHKYARGDINQTPTPNLSSDQQQKAKRLAQTAINDMGGPSMGVDDLPNLKRLLMETRQFLFQAGDEAVEDRFGDTGWFDAMRVYQWTVKSIENPVSKPEQPEVTDGFTQRIESRQNVGVDMMEKAYPLSLGVEEAFDRLESNGIHARDSVVAGVGKLLNRWKKENSVEYHREVVLQHSRKSEIKGSYPEWVKEFTPELQLYNCIPRDELRAVFGELGGGVLMSATLQPEDVFAEAVGINDIPYPGLEDEAGASDSDSETGSEVATQPSTDSDTDETRIRPSQFETYPIRFREENRLSIIADLPKYTSTNRGDQTTTYLKMNDVRQQYADLISNVVQSEGNIMVVMPNYSEAQWIHDFVAESAKTDKRLHLDQSSSALETEATLESFFEPGSAAIFTSNRGTITEGVDYDGEKLHGCIVVGIPLPYMSTRTDAVVEAYDRRMDTGSGYETAMKIPSVRKVRQAIGRVIRGVDENGVRVLADGRYADSGYRGANQYLSEKQQREFKTTSSPIRDIQSFWDGADN